MAGDASLRFCFVDVGHDIAPRDGVQYRLIPAADPVMRKFPVGDGCGLGDAGYELTVQVIAFWVNDLPDFRVNEAVLKLSAKSRELNNPSSKLDAATSLDFKARDKSMSSLDYELGFTGILVQENLVLGVDLVELDKDAREYYKKLKDAVGPAAGRELLDLAKGVPYVELATKIADGLVMAFGTNAHDVVWSSTPSFSVQPSSGGMYLRSGLYVLYEDTKDDLPSRLLGFQDRVVDDLRSGHRIDRNYMILSIGLRPPSSEVAQKMQAL